MVLFARVCPPLLVGVLLVACDGSEGEGSDAGVDRNSGSGIEHVEGEGGPHLGEEGCLYYTEEALEAATEITAGEGERLIDEDGEPIDIPPGEVMRVAPATICLSYDVEETTYRSTPLEEVSQRRSPHAPPPHLPCSETDRTLCPEATSEPINVPSARPDAGEPNGPFPYDAPRAPTEGSPCSDGMGFSFEDGVLAPWISDDFNGPVYGNNVSVVRLKPPGFTPSIEADIGGDYWEYSRDVNQGGNWWMGTADLREDHLTRPGRRLAESYTGVLWSPPFIVDAPYLQFVLGGTSDLAQRVELQVLSSSENEAPILETRHQGIGSTEFPDNWGAMPARDSVDPAWVIIRSASALEDGEYMGRRVVWRVDEFEGRTVRFRIVDEARNPVQEQICPSITHCVWVDRFAHVNADDFQCSQEAPRNTRFLPLALDPGQPPSDVGHVLTEQPLWGTSETHAHPTANLSFGGHFIWGDVEDELRTVYNCLDPLHAIPDLNREVVRPEIREPRTSTSCTVRAEVVAVLQSTAIGQCIVSSAPLAALPFVGPLIEAVVRDSCIAVVAGISAGLMTTPLITGHRYHGAEMPTSGAIEMGPMLSAFSQMFGSDETRIPGLVEERDFDRGDGTHSGQSFGQFHNHYQKDMIRRAWQGGMRLMVVDVHNGRALQAVLDGRDTYDDWTAIRDHVSAVERLVAGPGDPRFPIGALHDIAAIALTPSEARDIIRAGGIALVLGVEVAELGKLRFSGDSAERQVQDLHQMGIRKVTPIHGMDNPLGGTALFQDTYVAGTYYNNLTRDEENQDDSRWESLLPPVPVGLPIGFPFPFGGMPIGLWSPVDTLLPASCDGETCDCGPEGCPWNVENHGYFQTTATPGLPGLTDWIGGLRHVSFRLGMSDVAPLTPQFVDGEDILDTPSFLQPYRLHSLAWLLGRGGSPIPHPQCSLEGLFVPLPGNPPEAVMEGYRQPERGSSPRHFNAVGLREEGELFLTEMMAHGMLLDTDHFSQNTRLGTHRVTERFRDSAGLPEEEYPEYPVFGVHTELRSCERSGTSPSNVRLRDRLGYETELSKSEDEVRRIAEAGGTITVSVAGPMTLSPGCGTYAGTVVSNNCEFSSKSYAWKYLTAVDWMGGHGATPGFDMNGFAPGIASRFGAGNACRRIIDKRQYAEGGFTPETPDEERTPLALWPRDWRTGRTSDLCEHNGSMQAEFWDSECPSTQMLQAQLQEFSGVIYDDYADRPSWDTIPWLTTSDPNRRVVIARRSWELRDDGAERPLIDEAVAIGGGEEFRQIRPLRKWRNDNVSVPEGFNTGWDVNLDGMQHIGLFPDLIQDMRNGGVTWELLTPMFSAAEDFIRMWEKTCALANAFRSRNGLEALPDCE